MVVAAMRVAGVAPEQTVMVGDTTFDMEMALAAGSGALGVAWGYHPVEELRAAGAHGVVEASQHLPDGIDAYFTQREKAA
jgi:phosphoglycolate phosphatase